MGIFLQRMESSQNWPDKVQVIIDLPRPVDKSGDQSFCGSVQYLSKFIPNLSDKATVLRQLTRKDTPVYCGPNKELTIQSDASGHGLDSVLVKEDKPLVFISKALNDQQKGYVPMEKEFLGVVTAL